ncbi:MAG: AAA family ATPase [Propionibacteriales bacterium]|nr:AAA family ATPase [Propionibacteriales bacterium]
MSEGLFSAVDLASPARAGYRLHQLEVFNWGTFDQQVWRLTPGGETSLLTGDIGSGKSTLVDALTTLLLPAHKVAYNKAAGAESKERTLRSYVEGHYKSERIETSGRSRAIGLREGGKTYSVVLGVFVNDGYDETVTLAQVFHQKDRSTPDRFFVTATKGLAIKDDFGDFGADLKELRRRLRSGGAEIFNVFPDYSRSLRRLLGIRSQQALELFHQTVSMKSVGNLNEFVRDHMLEPADSSDRVREIITHFEDLTKAHDAVKRAREQLEALNPIVETSRRYDNALTRRAAQEAQRDAVRLFVAETRANLLRGELATFLDDLAQRAVERDDAKRALKGLDAERERLVAERAGAGGDRIGELERRAEDARRETDERRQRRDRYDAALAAASPEAVGTIVDAAAFAALTTGLPARRAEIEAGIRELDETVGEVAGELNDLGRDANDTRAELASLASRTSNLPGSHTDLRAQLCDDLGLDESELPFAGELLDVADEHAPWRGAAERVLRGFALSLLVPQEHYEAVARWVNGRRLTRRRNDGKVVGSKLVYERVSARRVPLQRQASAALLLADCLTVRDGDFGDYLRDELTRRADYRCVDSVEQFQAERRAVTREGQVRSGDRHEKDDRTKVGDPRTWVLGWANERKVAALTDLLTTQQQVHLAAKDRLAALNDRRAALSEQQSAVARLADYPSWAELDWVEAASRAQAADDERERFVAGSSTLAEIERRLAETTTKITQTETLRDNATRDIGRLEDRRDRARRDLDADEHFVAEQPSSALSAARESYDGLRELLGHAAPTTAAACDAARETLTGDLTRSIERLGREMGGYGTTLVQAMGELLRRWPELRSDLDASVETRADFLAFHERVATDDLPRHEGEFKRLLNTETIRELAQFNNWLRRQAEEIDARVARINDALGAIPYNPGRYIRLEKERTDNQDVQAFRADLRNATDDTVSADDDHYSEQRFLDVKRIIERFRGREGYAESDKSWTRRVTDVRNWFVFSASERDIETDEEWEHYSDSDGKSGGQKEKLAYTILAASLAYQFGLEWGAEKSRDFRFAVIDEAFGRGSDVSTRYALDLFDKLGLQLLIVTPLQKVHVIEPYVWAIGFVDNPTGTYSRLQTMTIEEFRVRRDRHRS